MPPPAPSLVPRARGPGAWPRLLVFAAICLLCWLPVLCNPGFYNHDELELLHDLRDRNVMQVLAQVASHFSVTTELFYRPLGFGLLRAQLALADGVPQLVHLLSLLHHLANAALFALLLRRLGRPVLAAWLLLLLPAALPGVAWAAGAYERWLLTFSLATLLLLAARRPLQWLALLTFALALCTKETAVVLPPIALLLVWRNQNARLVSALMLVTAVVFAIWRNSAAGAVADPDYHGHTVRESAMTLLRLVAWPCAVTAPEPRHVWGMHWIPGLLGMAALATLALLRSRPQAALAGCAFLLPLLPVATWSTPQGHYLYLAAPGLAFAVHLAIGTRPDWRWLLLLLLIAHSVVIGLHYRAMGTAMTNLDRAWRELPKSQPSVTVTVLPGSHGHVVRRYAHYLEAVREQPLLREREGEPLPGNLVLHPDGTVTAVR